ncbi:Leucine-Rich Repeat And Guanylate Kinase Domain-Containing Protein [Manis pentadactyla]|nr:Leucine-Rich Repeat And Guanylate Kinase Domain-Containing Protein [Manis pentadactyla]
MDVAWSCQFQFSKIDGNATQQGFSPELPAPVQRGKARQALGALQSRPRPPGDAENRDVSLLRPAFSHQSASAEQRQQSCPGSSHPKREPGLRAAPGSRRQCQPGKREAI